MIPVTNTHDSRAQQRPILVLVKSDGDNINDFKVIDLFVDCSVDANSNVFH